MAGYDKERELKAFDDTKAGVKGLVDAGVTEIPRFFFQPPEAADASEHTSDARPEIPVIDLAHGDASGRAAVVELVRRASETFGFFQVVNHGIPRDVLDRMLEGVRRFNNQDLEVKMQYYTRDFGRKVLFNSNFDLFHSPAANWRDSLFCLLKPEPAAKPEELPDAVRDIMLEYTGLIQKLGHVLFELLSEALGLETQYLNELECGKGLAHLSHYYPPCPEPHLTLGTSKHSDSSFLTVLLQDHIGGLQVIYQNQWIDVSPVPGALIVNIGDLLQDYLKSVVPSQLIAERGSNLVVINPGSANVRIGLAHQNVPYNIPHCIARYVKSGQKKHVQDQALNTKATPAQNLEREKAYNMIASLLKIPFLDEEAANNSFPRKMGRVDGYAPYQSRNDFAFTWTNVMDKKSNSYTRKDGKDTELHSLEPSKSFGGGDSDSEEYRFKEFICGEEALKISPSEPYCLSRPIRRGHLNISQDYTLHQVIADLCSIWDWILVDKLHILTEDRNSYSAVLVLPETFDNREIKEMLSIVLRDLRFNTAVVHQEGLAAAFGNGLSTACVVNIGAQVSSVICIEDGVALPSTIITLPYGGEDISRCLLWVQRRHLSWPSLHTDPVMKPIDMLMLNRIKEVFCQIREGEFDAVAVVHSYEEGKPVGSHKARLAALNVPPMGLFHPTLFIPEEYPPPPRSGFHDYEDMLEDTWHMDFTRRPEMSDGLYLGASGGVSMWDNYQVYPTRIKKDELVGLAEAITTSILSTGRIDLQRKLFCSMQLIGGVALIAGLVPAVEERVLHAIPSNEAIDTVEVLQSRNDPSFVSWKGGTILGILDFSRDAWIYREDWIRNGIHIGSGRKYKDSYFLQAQAMCYINS